MAFGCAEEALTEYRAVLTDKGQIAALAVLDEAVERFPEDGRLWAYRAEVGLTVRGDKADAESDLAKAMQLAPESPAVHGAAIGLLMHYGLDEEAQQHFDAACAGDPPDRLGIGSATSLLFKLGRPDEAVVLTKRLVDAYPNDLIALGNHATALHIAQRPREAEEALRRMRLAFPGHPRCVVAQVLITQMNQDPNEAISMLRTALEAMPDNSLAWGMLVRRLGSTGRIAEAEEAAKKALQIRPRNVMVLSALRNLVKDRGDETAAEELSRKIEECSPNAKRFEPLYEAKKLSQKKKYGEAMALLEPLMGSSELTLRLAALQMHARCCIGLCDWARLETDCGLMERDRDQSPTYMQAKGLVMMRQQRFQEAAVWWMAALQTWPRSGILRAEYITLLRIRQRHADLERAVSEAVGVVPNIPAEYVNLIRSVRRTGKHGAAAAMTARARESYPGLALWDHVERQWRYEGPFGAVRKWLDSRKRT